MGWSWGSYSEKLPCLHESISCFQSACQYLGLISPRRAGSILHKTLFSAFPLGGGFLFACGFLVVFIYLILFWRFV